MIASAALVAVGTANANPTPLPFSGDIAFQASAYTTDLAGGSLGTSATPATEVKSITGATVAAGDTDGSFSVIPSGTTVNFHTPIIFSPATPDSPLWTLNYGGLKYEFVASEMDAPAYTLKHGTTTINQVSLTGEGYVDVYNSINSLVGYGAGSWGLQLEKSGAVLTFQSGVSVPDGGLTAALLGGGMLVLGAIRRKLN